MTHIPDEKVDNFLAKIGEMVVLWNALEMLTQGIVQQLAGGGDKAAILTVNMGNVAVREALTTLTNEFIRDPAKAHLLHYAEYFDRLREYRNWIAHSIATLRLDEKGEVYGLSQSVSARKRLVLHVSGTRAKDIDHCIIQMITLLKYGQAIPKSNPTDDKTHPATQSLSSLEKPPLPNRLQKPILFPRDAKPLSLSFPV